MLAQMGSPFGHLKVVARRALERAVLHARGAEGAPARGPKEFSELELNAAEWTAKRFTRACLSRGPEKHP